MRILNSAKEKTMPLGKKSEDHKHADLEAQIADLKKEVAALKRALAAVKKSGGGGADPRVDKLYEALKKSPKFWLSKELL